MRCYISMIVMWSVIRVKQFSSDSRHEFLFSDHFAMIVVGHYDLIVSDSSLSYAASGVIPWIMFFQKDRGRIRS